MSLSDMQVFNQYIMPATIETLGQMVEKFNAASGGTIILTSEGFEGDFMEASFWSAVHGAQRRVDRYASNDAVAATNLAQLKNASVKVGGGFGPILFEPSQLSWLRKPTAEGIEVASRNFAEAMLRDQLNTAIAVLVAAIENGGAATTVDVSGSKVADYEAYNDTHAKFGDSSQALVASVMNGQQFHKLIGGNLTNTNRLFEAGNVRVVDILGRLSVVTDAPALSETGSPNKYKTLHLVSGAAAVMDGNDVIGNIETTNGKQRIETTMQVDYSFGVGIKGYTWDTTNGGKSPTDAELATGTNWDQTATDVKHTAGVLTAGAQS